jgi:hypothetical protein
MMTDTKTPARPTEAYWVTSPIDLRKMAAKAKRINAKSGFFPDTAVVVKFSIGGPAYDTRDGSVQLEMEKIE